VFDISFGELAVIGVVALVVIGPEKLPKVARTVGALVGRAGCAAHAALPAAEASLPSAVAAAEAAAPLSSSSKPT
jgi:Tat protein translocase TatB subunit